MPKTSYRGTINKVHASGEYGWINHKTVTNWFGDELYKNISKKDIFIHRDSCNAPLRVGMRVDFETMVDRNRERALKVLSGYEFVPEPSHIELHFEERVIDNPTVGARMCFSPEMHKRMIEGSKLGYGYSVLLIVRQHGDRRGLREQRSIKDPKLAFSYITFTRPAGNWDVGLILFERTYIEEAANTKERLERGITARFLHRDSNNEDRFKLWLPDLDTRGRPAHDILRDYCVWDGRPSFGVPIAAIEMKVTIPDGIFAEEPSAFAKALANRFSRKDSRDECQHRRRMAAMCTIGVVPWLLVEAFLRGVQILGGLLQLGCALRGSGSNILKVFEATSHFKVSFSLPRFAGYGGFYPPWNGRITQFLNPLFLAVGGAIAWWVLPFIFGLFAEGLNTATEATSTSFVSITIGIVAFVLLGLWIGKALRTSDEWKRSKREAEEKRGAAEAARVALRKGRRLEETLRAGRAEADVLARQAPALVCGEAAHEVSLEALPPEMRTLSLRFTALKRNICRPF